LIVLRVPPGIDYSPPSIKKQDSQSLLVFPLSCRMRPPRSARNRMRDLGEWRPVSPPPEFSPVDEFIGSVDADPVPMPGAFPSFSSRFSPPPPVEVAYDDVLSDVIVVLEDAVCERMVDPGVISRLAMTPGSCLEKILSAFFVSLAVQVSQAHQTCGFGEANLGALELPRLPPVLCEYSATFGEFVGPDTREWRLPHVDGTADSFVRVAHRIRHEGDVRSPIAQMWLPTAPGDTRSQLLVATRLSKWFIRHGFRVPVSDIRQYVFSGDTPPAVLAILKDIPPRDRGFVLRLFHGWHTGRHFLDMFVDHVGRRALSELGLSWENPSLSDLWFHHPTLPACQALLAEWRFYSSVLERGFDVSFRPGFSVRPAGSCAQHSRLLVSGERVSISSCYALSPGDRNLIACFGSAMVCDVPTRFEEVGAFDRFSILRALFSEDLGM